MYTFGKDQRHLLSAFFAMFLLAVEAKSNGNPFQVVHNGGTVVIWNQFSRQMFAFPGNNARDINGAAVSGRLTFRSAAHMEVVQRAFPLSIVRSMTDPELRAFAQEKGWFGITVEATEGQFWLGVNAFQSGQLNDPVDGFPGTIRDSHLHIEVGQRGFYRRELPWPLPEEVIPDLERTFDIRLHRPPVDKAYSPASVAEQIALLKSKGVSGAEERIALRFAGRPHQRIPLPVINCFAAGTLVRTKTGLIPIETLKSGDDVISEDQHSHSVTESRVVRTFVSRKKTLLLAISGPQGKEEIVTTDEHPFWVSAIGWTAAANLRIGDALITLNGDLARVSRIQRSEKFETVYNFEVEHHTYFVGKNALLVHNQCGPETSVRIPRRGLPVATRQLTALRGLGNALKSEIRTALIIAGVTAAHGFWRGVIGGPTPIETGLERVMTMADRTADWAIHDVDPVMRFLGHGYKISTRGMNQALVPWIINEIVGPNPVSDVLNAPNALAGSVTEYTLGHISSFSEYGGQRFINFFNQ